jgi:hypothetical protein
LNSRGKEQRRRIKKENECVAILKYFLAGDPTLTLPISAAHIFLSLFWSILTDVDDCGAPSKALHNPFELQRQRSNFLEF